MEVMDDVEVSPLRIRQALGHFASGVTVVTTATGDADEPEVHGMTANAFTSVSLRPPLVLVSVGNAARTNRRIAETGRYGISVLSGDQAPLSGHFAGGTPCPELVDFVWRDGMPLLDGALVHLVCSLTDSHPAGVHTLHVGRIERLWYRNGSPLLFYTGQLSSLDPQ
jgi:flavin reductase (DIM6/NTAB) family NADH-FMN oxidoreductase RutF